MTCLLIITAVFVSSNPFSREANADSTAAAPTNALEKYQLSNSLALDTAGLINKAPSLYKIRNRKKCRSQILPSVRDNVQPGANMETTNQNKVQPTTELTLKKHTIKLGMSFEQVVDLLGRPDSTWPFLAGKEPIILSIYYFEGVYYEFTFGLGKSAKAVVIGMGINAGF